MLVRKFEYSTLRKGDSRYNFYFENKENDIKYIFILYNFK